VLFRQRVASWDVTTHAKFGHLLFEFFFNWCREWRTLILKPFLFYEIMCVIIDWQRLYLLVGLLNRDASLLAFVTVSNFTMFYLELFLFSFVVLRNRYVSQYQLQHTRVCTNLRSVF